MKALRNATKATCAALVAIGPQAIQPAMAQGQNNLWLGGYNFSSPLPEDSEYYGWDGGVNLEFGSGALNVITQDRLISFSRTNANITDSAGTLLFSTNGAYIANATGQQMINGGGISPCWYTSQYPNGLHINQAVLILPWPENPGLFIMIHGSYEDPSNIRTFKLYWSAINMSLDGGRGGMIAKNQVLLDDTLNQGKITAIRHANGRDWWVFCHKWGTNRYFRLLMKPDGINLDGVQSMGVERTWDGGQVCFSPNGSRFAYYYPGPWGLEIFDFDRCTGLFSNPVHIPTVSMGAAAGVAFSPNGRYLYVSSSSEVYQFDAEAPDVAASKVVVAVWDSTYSPFPPFATKFDLAQLAPDGKIYIGTGNSTFRLHVIHNPDEPGLACNLEQHGVELPRLYMNSLPNHPNYHLGALSGTVCDSLGLSTLTPTLSQEEGAVHAFPNPSADGRFTLQYPAHAGVGWLEVRNLAGQLVLRERLPQWSTMHAVELTGQAAGLYNCTLRWGAQTATTRVMLTER